MELGYLNQITQESTAFGTIAESAQLRWEYTKSRFNDITTSFQEAFSKHLNKKTEIAKTVGVSALLGAQFTILDEWLLSRVGSETLQASGPLKAIGVVTTANFLEHYLAGKAAEKTEFPSIFHENLDERISEDESANKGPVRQFIEKIVGGYSTSLFFGTGPAVAIDKTKGKTIKDRFSAKSAAIITSFNLPIVAAAATTVEATNSSETLNNSWLGTAWLFGFLALSLSRDKNASQVLHLSETKMNDQKLST